MSVLLQRGQTELALVTLTKARTGLRKILEGVVLSLMTSLALVVVVGVVFRKSGASLVWYDEVASILLAWLTYYGAALAALHRAHIGVPTLVDKLSRNLRMFVVLVAEVLVLAVLGTLTWTGIQVLSVLGSTTLISLPWVPAAVAQSVIPIGATLFIGAQLLSLPDAMKHSVSGSAKTSPNAGSPTGEAPQ